MSNYGADDNPVEHNMHIASYGYGFTDAKIIQGDQYTISGDLQVLKFCDGTKKINIRMKVIPAEISTI